MKTLKIDWFKFTRFIFICIFTILFSCLIYNFIKYPECYLSTWKYQLKNEIYNGDLSAISLYENVYVKNRKDLFEDNFEIRKTYIKKPEPKVITVKSTDNLQTPKMKSLGTYISTAYCTENYPHICNNGNASTTATGTVPTPGRTIAVDPNIISYGTKVMINGHTYIAEDCGGGIKGNRVDIVFKTHEEALQYGRQTVEVFIYE